MSELGGKYPDLSQRDGVLSFTIPMALSVSLELQHLNILKGHLYQHHCLV